MTNHQFERWLHSHFRSDNACSKALGIDRDTVRALREGKTRNGTVFPVRAHIALACEAWSRGVRDFDGSSALVEERT